MNQFVSCCSPFHSCNTSRRKHKYTHYIVTLCTSLPSFLLFFHQLSLLLHLLLLPISVPFSHLPSLYSPCLLTAVPVTTKQGVSDEVINTDIVNLSKIMMWRLTVYTSVCSVPTLLIGVTVYKMT